MSVKNTVVDVIKSILPITIVMLLLQLLLTEINFGNFFTFIFGVFITIIGFTLFLIGVDNSLIMLGELSGRKITETKCVLLINWSKLEVFCNCCEQEFKLLANQLDLVSSELLANTFIITVSLALVYI